MRKTKKAVIIGTLTTSLFIGGIVSAAGIPLWYSNYLNGISTPAGTTTASKNYYPTVPDQSAENPPTMPAESTVNVNLEEQTLFNLLNQERQQRGLSPLQLNTTLVEIARKKSKDMADLNYFNHVSPTYGKAIDMVRAAGISHKMVGENIAITSTAERANTLFMGSSIHRATRLNRNFTEVGIGMFRKANGSLYVTEIFLSNS